MREPYKKKTIALVAAFIDLVTARERGLVAEAQEAGRVLDRLGVSVRVKDEPDRTGGDANE